VFSVNIDATESVDVLKDKIKRKKENHLNRVDADKLQLFLCRNFDGTWLDSSTYDIKKLMKGEKTALIEALAHEDNELQGDFGLEEVLKNPKNFEERFERNKGEFHVLVIVPKQDIPHNLQGIGWNHVPVDEWFVNKLFFVQNKKYKLDKDKSNQFTRYFKTVNFPPLESLLFAPLNANKQVRFGDRQ
jgi:Crinkler effector protein N-terminal domain